MGQSGNGSEGRSTNAACDQAARPAEGRSRREQTIWWCCWSSPLEDDSVAPDVREQHEALSKQLYDAELQASMSKPEDAGNAYFDCAGGEVGPTRPTSRRCWCECTHAGRKTTM